MKRWLIVSIVPLVILAIVLLSFRVGSDVRPDDIEGLIDRADQLVVFDSPRSDASVLFRSSDQDDFASLKLAVRVDRPDASLHCMCDGTPAIVLYAQNERIGLITNHHANLIRCSLWKSDAPIVDREKFLQWFDERNIPGPRKEYQAELERRRESMKSQERWLAAMPPALKSHWPAMVREIRPDHSPLRASLATDMPDRKTRILGLFNWYGAGEGPWSGFPAYESVAESLLLDYSTADLLQAIENQQLTVQQTEGVARLFAGFSINRDRPEDLLPAELKFRLLEHSLASTDIDKRGRAQRAFDGE